MAGDAHGEEPAEATERLQHLLALLSRVRPVPAIAPADGEGVDLERLLLVAGRFGNYALIGTRLLASGILLPDGLRERVARNLAFEDVRARLTLADAAGLASELGRVGAELLLLKGGAYTRFIYPAPGLRSFLDVDVLVAPDAAAEAARALSRLGYEPYHAIEGSTEYVKRLGAGRLHLVIELHTSLVHHHEYPYYREELLLDERRLLARGEERRLDGAPVKVLRAEDELFYSVLHFFFHHDLRGLKYHSDLNALLTDGRRAIDVDRAVAAARSARADLAVGLALLVHERLFGPGSVPAPLLARLAPRGLRLRALRRALPPLDRLPFVVGRVAGHPAKILVAPGWLGPAGLALRRLFPGKRFLMSFYDLSPGAWSGRYRVRYPVSVLGRGIRRTVFRSREA